MNDSSTESSLQPKPFASLAVYQCHKQVRAFKISSIERAPSDQERANAGGDWYLSSDDGNTGQRVMVGHDSYFAKHKPEVGGYFVAYEDGYTSYSPAAAFESGYTRI